jgi:hypothetical protein
LEKEPGKLMPGASPSKEIVWNPLQNDGKLTEQAFAALVPYLKRMSEFIEIAVSDGIAGVTTEFELPVEARFSILQKKIRAQVSASATSEFDPPAGRAFQVGSTKCAALLLKRQDPTKFMVDKVVEAVRKDPDHALIQSAESTLDIFGERILTSVLPGGKTSVSGVEKVIRDFRARLKTFVSREGSAANWGSNAIAATMAKLTRSLIS